MARYTVVVGVAALVRSDDSASVTDTVGVVSEAESAELVAVAVAEGKRVAMARMTLVNLRTADVD